MMWIFKILFCQTAVCAQFVGIKNINSNKYSQKYRCTKQCSNGEGIQDYVDPPPLNISREQASFVAEQKTIPTDIFLEVLVSVDDKLYEKVGKWYNNGIWNKNKNNPELHVGDQEEEVTLYIRKFITAVNFRFENKFPTPNIKLHISDIMIEKNPSFVDRLGPYYSNAINTSKTLTNMVTYFGRKVLYHDPKADLVIFLTGERELCDIKCKNEPRLNGLAFRGGACYGASVPGLMYGAAIVRDSGAFSGVFSAAHEIGHILGATHDGNNNCCCSDDGFIMHSSLSYSRAKQQNIHRWSKCACEDINSFLSSAQAAQCLYNKPIHTPYPLMEWEDLIAPNVPSLTDQCSVSRKTGAISMSGVCGNDPCNYLQCKTSEKICDLFSPAMDGSRCQNGSLCFHGKCLFKDSVTKSIWLPGGCFNAKERTHEAINLGNYANKWDCLDSCRAITSTTACEWCFEHKDCFAYKKEVTNAYGDSIPILCYIFKSHGVFPTSTQHSNNIKWRKAEPIEVRPDICGGEGTTTKSPGKKTTKKNEKTTTKKKLTTWTTAIPFPKENRLVDCPPGWKKHNKHCYKFLMENVGDLNFDSSEQYCIDLVPDMNANIVQIDNRKQQNWIEGQIKRARKQAKSKRKLEPFYISRPFDLDTNKKRYLNFYTGSKRYKIHCGQCLDANKEKQVDGIINMGKASNKDDCMRTCDMFISTYGCEYDIKNRDCRAIHGELKSGDYTANHLCFIWSSQHGTETELAEKSVRVMSQTRPDYNYWLNDTENICMAAVFDPKQGDAPWRYALCTQPMENIMCMFKQRTSDAFCTISDAPWDKDPHKQKGFYSCEEKKDTQYFCHNSDEYGYCTMKRQEKPYENEKLCGMACRQYTYSRKGFQCIYYIYHKTRRTCTFMVVCEKLFKLDICEDTAAKDYVSGKCFQQNNDYTHVVKVNINQDLDRCKWIDPPVGKWFIGDCKAKGRKKVTRGTTDLDTHDNAHLCLERCNSVGALTGCNYDKVTKACKGHTESVKSGNGVGTARCFVFKQHTNRKRGGSTTEPLTKGPFQKIWTDEQCPNLERGPHNSNLADCKYACEDNPDCNAINFNAGFGDDYAECVLRACPVPIPKPTWKYKKYKGYSS